MRTILIINDKYLSINPKKRNYKLDLIIIVSFVFLMKLLFNITFEEILYLSFVLLTTWLFIIFETQIIFNNNKKQIIRKYAFFGRVFSVSVLVNNFHLCKYEIKKEKKWDGEIYNKGYFLYAIENGNFISLIIFEYKKDAIYVEGLLRNVLKLDVKVRCQSSAPEET